MKCFSKWSPHFLSLSSISRKSLGIAKIQSMSSNPNTTKKEGVVIFCTILKSNLLEGTIFCTVQSNELRLQMEGCGYPFNGDSCTPNMIPVGSDDDDGFPSTISADIPQVSHRQHYLAWRNNQLFLPLPSNQSPFLVNRNLRPVSWSQVNLRYHKLATFLKKKKQNTKNVREDLSH